MILDQNLVYVLPLMLGVPGYNQLINFINHHDFNRKMF